MESAAPESGEDLGALLESTLTLSRGLETLYSEHEALLEALGEDGRENERGEASGSYGERCTGLQKHAPKLSSSYTGLQPSEELDESEEFAVQTKVEKTAALSHSLDLLKAGIDEAKVRMSPPPELPP